MKVNKLLVARVPAKKHAVRTGRGNRKISLFRKQLPMDAVTRIRRTQAPLGIRLVGARIELVHVQHLVAPGGVRLLIILDQIRTTQLLPATRRLRRRNDVVRFRSLKLRQTEFWLVPFHTVTRNSIAGLVAALLHEISREVVYVAVLDSRADDIGAIPHLEELVFLIVHNGTVAQIYSGSPLFPCLIGENYGVIADAGWAMPAAR